VAKKVKTEEKKKRRGGNRPWKHILGTDRKYTARVERVNRRAGSRPASWEQTHDTDPQSKSASSEDASSGVTLVSLLSPSTEA
jgi:hypothetical protein